MKKLYKISLTTDEINTVRNALSLAVIVSKSIPNNKRAIKWYEKMKAYFDMEYEKQSND